MWLFWTTSVTEGIRPALRLLYPTSLSSTKGGRAARYTRADDDGWRDLLRSKYGISQ